MQLVFFGLALSSSWGNGHAVTYRSLLRGLNQLGHRVVFYEQEQEWYQSNRDLPRPDFCDLRLLGSRDEAIEAARRAAHAAEAVVVGSFTPHAIALLDVLLASGGARIGFYDIDTPITLSALGSGDCGYLRPDQIPALDAYLSFTGGPLLDQLRRAYGARNAAPLYCSFDPEHYGPAQPNERFSPELSNDLSYMGTYSPDRQSKLKRLLLEPARRLPRQKFLVAGPLYPGTAEWPPNVAYIVHLYPRDHRALYAGSRFCLNLTRQAMVEAGYSPSIRLFEAAACGAAIVTDPWPGLETFFQPGAEILVASETGDILRLLGQRDNHAELRRAARARVMEQHTGRKRAEELLSVLAPARQAALPQSAGVPELHCG